MEHAFRLRPSDSFELGSRKISLYRIHSNKRVTLKVIEGETVSRVELTLGTPFVPEPSVSIALDPNTSRSSMSAGLLITAPDSMRVTSPD